MNTGGIAGIGSMMCSVGPLLSLDGELVEGVEGEHSLAEPFGELPALLFDVREEGVRSPSADEHDGMWWDILEVELHGQ